MSRDSGSNNGRLINNSRDNLKLNTRNTDTSNELNLEQDKEDYKREIIFNIEIFKSAFKTINKSLDDYISKNELLAFLDSNMQKVIN